jgi:hypothetical protein
MNLEPDTAAQKDIDYLLEAYDYGQFADDMFDHPSPSCRSPCKPLREALRRHLDWLQAQTTTLKAKPSPPPSPDFIQRTNTEYAKWCKTYYVAEALDHRGMASLHGLWAWQEQERRHIQTSIKSSQPVAWVHEWAPHASVIGKSLHWTQNTPHKGQMIVTPLYASTPPKCQPLTDAEIEDCINKANRKFNGRSQQITIYDGWKYCLVREAERALGVVS